MGQREFGELVSRYMEEVGISQRRLASRIGELSDGSLFDSTSIRTIREGQRRLTHELVARLILILGMDSAEAWAASGLLPPEVSAEDLRRVQQFRRAAEEAEQRVVATTGSSSEEATATKQGWLKWTDQTRRAA